MNYFIQIVVLVIFSSNVLAEGKDQQDAIIDKLVQIEFDQAKYARELILLDADLKTRQKKRIKKDKRCNKKINFR